MIIMNIELDNLLLFREFSMNLSYPKKPVHTTINDEHLAGRNNFRYKKLVAIFGANATGKTALSKVLMSIFNFITYKEASRIFALIDNKFLPASFSIDVAFSNYQLYRISAIINGKKNSNDEYNSDDIKVYIKNVKINTKDSYETCLQRLNKMENIYDEFYVKTLDAIPKLSWLFEDPFASDGRQRAVNPPNTHIYADILRQTLQVLDPRIKDVKEVTDVKNTYAIIYPNNTVLIQDGIVSMPDKLSSGTKDGLGVAQMITGMKINAYAFYYCDEKFSHIHTDIEKAFLSVMVDLLGNNEQLFFTTHNLDILEMDFPLHSFAFLKRDDSAEHYISCSFASDYLKKNNISLRNAVENDLFSTVPSTTQIFTFSEN